MTFKKLVALFAAGAALLAAGEATVRVAGIGDVPIRSANHVTGYIPIPHQSGKFLANDWHINNLSMISSQDYLADSEAIIVAGDSVVFGGNALSQRERVGEQLRELTGYEVFAIADGSWGFKNEIAYFSHTKALIGNPKTIIFILNDGDFGPPCTWKCFSTHPVSKPMSHLFFVLRKYFAQDCAADSPPEFAVKDVDISDSFRDMLAEYPDTTFSIVLYPSRNDYRRGKSFATRLRGIDAASPQKLRVVDIAELGRAGAAVWSDSYYLDDIHPNARGARALAEVIRDFALWRSAE